MAKQDPSVVGRNLFKYRMLQHMTQEQLAEKSGVRQNYISRIESGFTKEPHVTRGYKLAEALGITVKELVEEQP